MEMRELSTYDLDVEKTRRLTVVLPPQKPEPKVGDICNIHIRKTNQFVKAKVVSINKLIRRYSVELM